MEVRLFLDVPPRPASRPRAVCRGKFPTVYNDPGYSSWLSEAREKLRANQPTFADGEPFKGDVWVAVEVIVKRPKTTVKVRPSGDVDNYVKGVLDAITQAGGYWVDDDQVVEGVYLKRWASENETPGYKITLRFRGAEAPAKTPANTSKRRAA